MKPRQLPLIEIAAELPIGTITLDRPQRHNALSKEMADSIVEALNRAKKYGFRVVIYVRGLVRRCSRRPRHRGATGRSARPARLG